LSVDRSVLWAGWRHLYFEPGRGKGARSVFRDILASGRPDDETLIVRRGEECFAIMNLHPYSSGHLMVLPYREVADPADLSSTEAVELWTMVTQAIGVLRSAIAADGVNVGLNLGPAAGGSVPEHLHVHVVPRWSGDVNFLGSTADTRVIPEALDVTAARIRAAWASSVSRT
jgi:ATP adenylyltransferase